MRIAPGSTLSEDASWTVLPASCTKSVDVQQTKDATSVGFRNASLDVRFERNPLHIVVRDLAGDIICADAPAGPTEFSLAGFSVSKEMPANERFVGLGDKTGWFGRRNQAYTLWKTDHGIEEPLDPIYTSIPFFRPKNRRLDIPKAAKGWSTLQTSTSALMVGFPGGAVGDLGPYARGSGTLPSPLRPGTLQIKYRQDFLARFAEKYWLSPAATSFSPRSRLTSNAVTTAEISLPCTGWDWE